MSRLRDAENEVQNLRQEIEALEILDVLGAYGLMLVFSFAMIWVGVLLGSLVATPEGVQGVAFVVIFPVTFIASTFVPTSTLPGVLKTVAEWNPTSSLANALRYLFENPGGALPAFPTCLAAINANPEISPTEKRAPTGRNETRRCSRRARWAGSGTPVRVSRPA